MDTDSDSDIEQQLNASFGHIKNVDNKPLGVLIQEVEKRAYPSAHYFETGRHAIRFAGYSVPERAEKTVATPLGEKYSEIAERIFDAQGIPAGHHLAPGEPLPLDIPYNIPGFNPARVPVFGIPAGKPLLGRFAQLTLLEIDSRNPAIFPVIIKFIPFIEDPDISEFFTEIFPEEGADSETLAWLHTGLLNAQWIPTIDKHLSECTPGVLQLLFGLYNLVISSTHSPIIGPVIRDPAALEHLHINPRDGSRFPPFLKDARWRVTNALVTAENYHLFSVVIDNAAGELDFGSGLFSYHIEILRFLTFLANVPTSDSVDNKIPQQLVDMGFKALLLTILTDYPNHSIGISAVFECLAQLACNPILGPHVWSILPNIADIAVDGPRIVRGLSQRFLCQVINWRNDPTIDSLLSPIEGHPCWEHMSDLAFSIYGMDDSMEEQAKTGVLALEAEY
jgi:hypothetical protein